MQDTQGEAKQGPLEQGRRDGGVWEVAWRGREARERYESSGRCVRGQVRQVRKVRTSSQSLPIPQSRPITPIPQEGDGRVGKRMCDDGCGKIGTTRRQEPEEQPHPTPTPKRPRNPTQNPPCPVQKTHNNGNDQIPSSDPSKEQVGW
jgi:hypothetical protein